MDDRLRAAATIAASQLHENVEATPEQIAELLGRAFEGIEIAVSLERKRAAQRQADLKSGTVATRRTYG